ncbi:LPS export ABC transporter periplasmic protein LptC [Roseospirillum parvum]|uniref:Lipopolysaccharide export system protein LptC n=1 Tax=Roseospirillum parvum TaxID=83401 RepID=A0A1G8B847_9PROT|nr:LPS export ABC transporter periplasmic protein LptC [Roseospirillum parvum]SDH29335.1 lipopolysaccharide export system protein LptC [Roseospirillum parvum]
MPRPAPETAAPVPNAAAPPPVPLPGARPPTNQRRLGRASWRLYSRFVALMKVMLPATALVLVGLILLWPQVNETADRFALSVSSLSTDRVGTLSMINARYFGIDAENRPFTVTADSARETAPGSKIIELEAPKADITLKDGTWLVLGAASGFYDQPGQTLDLIGQVNLFHDGGYELHTPRAEVDFAAGAAGSDHGVSGHGPFGEVRAEGFRLIDQGARIRFLGQSRVVLRPGRPTP